MVTGHGMVTSVGRGKGEKEEAVSIVDLGVKRFIERHVQVDFRTENELN